MGRMLGMVTLVLMACPSAKAQGAAAVVEPEPSVPSSVAEPPAAPPGSESQPSGAGAAPAAEEGGRTPFDVPAVDAQPARTRLVVLILPLTAKRVDESWASTLDDLLIAELGRRSELKVTALADVNELIAQQQRRDLLGCEEVACAAEVGGALGADRILAGSVGHLGDEYVITLRWLDVVYNDALAHVARPLLEASARQDLRRALDALLDQADPTDSADRRRKHRPTFWTVELGAGGDLMFGAEPYDTELHGSVRLAWGGRTAGLRTLFYAVGGLSGAYFSGADNGLTGRLRYERLQLTPFAELRAAVPVALRERTRLYGGLGAGLTLERFAARQVGGVKPSGVLTFPELRGCVGAWHRWHRHHSVWGGYLGRVQWRGDGADSISELNDLGSSKTWVWVHAFELGWAFHF